MYEPCEIHGGYPPIASCREFSPHPAFEYGKLGSRVSQEASFTELT